LSKVINIRKNCDALFLPTYPEEGAALLKQLKEYNINLPVFGGDTWANNLLISLGGTSVENVRFLAPMQYEGLEFQSFEKKYHIKFGTEPDLPASAGYDAMKLILKCLKDLKASNQNITGDNLKALLYKIQNFKGATGITTFDSNGDVISKEFSRRTIIDGNIVTTDK
jgi:branched-chain amino acid transport system substrate-binding protein